MYINCLPRPNATKFLLATTGRCGAAHRSQRRKDGCAQIAFRRFSRLDERDPANSLRSRGVRLMYMNLHARSTRGRYKGRIRGTSECTDANVRAAPKVWRERAWPPP